MVKVLIVDDDLPVRMDLRSLLDWADFGLELTDDAANGAEALERIRQNRPDIIILDLGMPVMNGLEVIRKLKEEKYGGKIVVLSCHDDFNSVSEALKMGAVDYLLKYRMKREDLSASVTKALDLLKAEDSDRLERQRIADIGLPVIRSNLVVDLVTGNLKDRDGIASSLAQLGMDLRLGKYVLGLLEPDDLFALRAKLQKSEMKRLLKSAGDVLDATLKGNGCLYGGTGEGEFCFIIDFSPSSSFMQVNGRTYELCERVLSNMKSYLGIQASIGLSRICEDICSASDCYAQARQALDGKLYLGRNRIIHFSEVENYSHTLEHFLSEYEERINRAVLTDEAGIDGCIRQIFATLEARNVKPEFIKFLCFELLMLSSRMSRELSLDDRDVYGCDPIPYDYVMNMETLEDIEAWFAALCHRISRLFPRCVSKPLPQDVRQEIRKAIAYIERNYMVNFSLQEIADHCGMSRNYFSQVFRQEMKESFIDFLTRYRIEKAKHLLKTTNMKVYEIGTACGFENYRYFSRLFRDLTGSSPLEFRAKTPS